MNNAITRLLLILSCMIAMPWNASARILIGSYYGQEGWNMTEVAHQEQWQGEANAVINLFTDFDPANATNLFDQQLMAIWNHGSVPMVSWMPYHGTSTPTDIAARIAAGDYDVYLDDWSSRMLAFLAGPDGSIGTSDDRRVYLRFAHEMNSNWYLWSIDPVAYVAMWQHVYNIFANKGITASRLQWVWSVNNTDQGFYPAEQYYPGDAFVDWLAMDGYNWGQSWTGLGWQNPTAVFGDMLARLRLLASNKPVAITEVGSSTDSAGIDPYADKSQWITNMFQFVQDQGIGMISWFNRDKEMDWAVFGGNAGDETYLAYKAYAAYRQAVIAAPGVLPDRTSARLISDADFLSDATAGTGTGAFVLPPVASNPYASVTLELLSSWNSGFCARAHLAVNQDVNDWSVDIYHSGTVTGLWGTDYQNISTNEVRASANAGNYLLHAGEQTSFDFCADGSLQTTVVSGIQANAFGPVIADSSTLHAQGNFISTWIGGYCMDVIIQNTTAQDQLWMGVMFSLPDSSMSSTWNASYSAVTGDSIASPLSWNPVVPANGSINIGFCANGRNHVGLVLP